MAQKTKSSKVTASDRNLIAALSYVYIFSVILYVLKKDDEYVQFHARQGIVIFAMAIIGVIPVLGWPIGLLAFALVIIGAVKAYQGEKYRIPVIADLADKVNF